MLLSNSMLDRLRRHRARTMASVRTANWRPGARAVTIRTWRSPSPPPAPRRADRPGALAPRAARRRPGRSGRAACAWRWRSSGRPSASWGRCCRPGPTWSPPRSRRSSRGCSDDVPPLPPGTVEAQLEAELGACPGRTRFSSFEPTPARRRHDRAGAPRDAARRRRSSSRCSGRTRSATDPGQTSPCWSCSRAKPAAPRAEPRARPAGGVRAPLRVAAARARLPQEAATSSASRRAGLVLAAGPAAGARRALDRPAARDGGGRAARRSRPRPTTRAHARRRRQLLASLYRQVLAEGFFHADPHPGNCCSTASGCGSSTSGWSASSARPSEAGAAAAAGVLARRRRRPRRGDAALRRRQRARHRGPGGVRARPGLVRRPHRGSTMAEVELGPVLEGLGGIAARHGVRLPAELVLAGKALAQVQLTASRARPRPRSPGRRGLLRPLDHRAGHRGAGRPAGHPVRALRAAGPGRAAWSSRWSA